MVNVIHMSNTTIMFGIMVLFAVGVIFSSPIIASAVPQQQGDFLDLKNAKLSINKEVITDAKFTAKGDIPIVNPGINWGYGIITAGGNVIVTTSHPQLPIADSELQNGDPENDVIHNHYVVLTTNELCGLADPQDPTGDFNPSVADLTFKSPGDIFVKQNLAILKNLPPSVTGGNVDPTRVFTPGTDYQDAASFKLEYVQDRNDPKNFAVCVVLVKTLDPQEESTVTIGEKDMKPDYPSPGYENRDGYGNEYDYANEQSYEKDMKPDYPSPGYENRDGYGNEYDYANEQSYDIKYDYSQRY